jgi:hypothetical protein
MTAEFNELRELRKRGRLVNLRFARRKKTAVPSL